MTFVAVFFVNKANHAVSGLIHQEKGLQIDTKNSSSELLLKFSIVKLFQKMLKCKTSVFNPISTGGGGVFHPMPNKWLRTPQRNKLAP